MPDIAQWRRTDKWSMSEKGIDSITLSRELLAEMVIHCREVSPEEACGILAGKSREVKKVYRMTNVEGSQITYRIDPDEQFRIMKEMRQEGLDMVAIYHSHPASRAYPSATDVRLAFYEDPAYVIVSLADSEPDIRAYTIRDKEIKEITYDIT